MNSRFLMGLGLAFALVFVCGLAAVLSVNSMTDRVSVTSVPAVKQGAPSVVSAPVTAIATPVSLPNPAAAAAPVAGAAPAGSTGYTVLDSDLANLAAAVKLGATSTGDVTRDVWVRELPIAQNLQKGMCDCDQRNWLKHFVETAQEAISGSNHYPASVQLLAQLRRGNNVLTTAQAAH